MVDNRAHRYITDKVESGVKGGAVALYKWGRREIEMSEGLGLSSATSVPLMRRGMRCRKKLRRKKVSHTGPNTGVVCLGAIEGEQARGSVRNTRAPSKTSLAQSMRDELHYEGND